MNVIPICGTWFCVINITETLTLRRPSCRPRSIEVCSYWTNWLFIIYMWTTWLKCILWGTRFPPTLCQWCGRGRSLFYWINDLTVTRSCFCCFPPLLNPLHLYLLTLDLSNIALSDLSLLLTLSIWDLSSPCPFSFCYLFPSSLA